MGLNQRVIHNITSTGYAKAISVDALASTCGHQNVSPNNNNTNIIAFSNAYSLANFDLFN